MKHLTFLFLTCLIAFSCKKESGESSSSYPETGSDNGNANYPAPAAGAITAGEWNDLNNWEFWKGIMVSDQFSQTRSYWDFYHTNRISVFIKDNEGNPVTNEPVILLENDYPVWESETDNKGYAELWINLFYSGNRMDGTENYTLKVNGNTIDQITLKEQGINEVTIENLPEVSNSAEISFVVDATGSMGDELEFLKEDLKDVIEQSKTNNSNTTFYTSAVFYRDNNDEYVTRKSDFNTNINATMDFINQQTAQGGGDYPEAVHTALDVALNDLQWSNSSKSKLLFLLLDAPPHHNYEVINELHNLITTASAKGIKIIPIAASGIDVETEFLLRFLAMTTNGTYVFITDDSGIGNDHLEASVGNFEVRPLNSLLVNLINRYTE